MVATRVRGVWLAVLVAVLGLVCAPIGAAAVSWPAVDGAARQRSRDRRDQRVGRVRRAVQRVERRSRPGRAGARLRDVDRRDGDAQADVDGARPARASPPAGRELGRRLRGGRRRDVQRRPVGDGRVVGPADARRDGDRLAQLGRCRVLIRRVAHRERAACGARASSASPVARAATPWTPTTTWSTRRSTRRPWPNRWPRPLCRLWLGHRLRPRLRLRPRPQAQAQRRCARGRPFRARPWPLFQRLCLRRRPRLSPVPRRVRLARS